MYLFSEYELRLLIGRGYKVDLFEVPERIYTVSMGKSSSKVREGVLKRRRKMTAFSGSEGRKVDEAVV